MCWRDFHRQVLAARPETSVKDYRSRHDRWRTGDEAADDIAAWNEGRTGYPAVDAAMRQLDHEGWMHNRGRLLAASLLTKTPYVDWRIGARHFQDLLVDGDIASNQLNWPRAQAQTPVPTVSSTPSDRAGAMTRAAPTYAAGCPS